MRRVVTGYSPNGKSIFMSDGKPPRVVSLSVAPELEFIEEIWATDNIPAIPIEQVDPTVKMASFVPGPGGTRFRINRFPPDQEFARVFQKASDLEATIKEYQTKAPGLMESPDMGNPGMHATATVDYIIILSGEIWLELDDGAEVHLKSGDCVVQNGTRHAWRNRGSETCILACVMIGVEHRTP